MKIKPRVCYFIAAKSTSILIFSFFLVACGPSAEEVATMTAEAWTATPAPTSTPIPTPTLIPTPTSTPVPYDLTVTVVDEEGQPLEGATVQLAGDEQSQTADSSGKVGWNDLTNITPNLIVDAQGYTANEESFTLERGSNEISVILALDPSELHPSQACLPTETLITLEDLEDGRGQEWGSIAEEIKPSGWSVVSLPDEPEDLVLQITADAMFADINHPTPRNFVFRWLGRIDGSGSWGISIFERRTVDVPKTQYNIFVNTTSSSIHRFHLEANMDIPLIQGPAMISGTWYKFEFSFFEGTIEVWANGELWMSVVDPDPFPSEGRGSNIQFSPESDSTIFYADDFSICELSVPFVSIFAPQE